MRVSCVSHSFASATGFTRGPMLPAGLRGLPGQPGNDDFGERIGLTAQPALDATEFHAIELPETRHELFEIHLVVEEAAVEGESEIRGDDNAGTGSGSKGQRVRRREAVGTAGLRRAVEIDRIGRGDPADRLDKAAERAHELEVFGRAVAVA